MSFNHGLANASYDFDFIKDFGFSYHIDNPEDHRGNWWEFKNDKFMIHIDAWYEVTLSRLNPDTDSIKVKVENKFELEELLEFITDYE